MYVYMYYTSPYISYTYYTTLYTRVHRFRALSVPHTPGRRARVQPR